MIGCDAVRFVVMAFFAIAYYFHVLTLPMIYGGLVIISICAAGFLADRRRAFRICSGATS